MYICLIFSVLTILNFLLNHWDVLLTVVGALLYAVKSTRWGKANAQALSAVAGVIEHLDVTEVKAAVKAKSSDLPKAVIDAIEDAVNTVDEKKPTPTATDVVLREVTRVKE